MRGHLLASRGTLTYLLQRGRKCVRGEDTAAPLTRLCWRMLAYVRFYVGVCWRVCGFMFMAEIRVFFKILRYMFLFLFCLCLFVYFIIIILLWNINFYFYLFGHLSIFVFDFEIYLFVSVYMSICLFFVFVFDVERCIFALICLFLIFYFVFHVEKWDFGGILKCVIYLLFLFYLFFGIFRITDFWNFWNRSSFFFFNWRKERLLEYLNTRFFGIVKYAIKKIENKKY